MSQLSVLVNKLGHHLEEIRSRALHTIISKLDYGLITEDELLDKDNLFKNLVKWFQFKNVTAKIEVLKLILRLLQCEDGRTLLLKADPGLRQLRELSDCDILVQDIVNIISKQVNTARYAESGKNGDFKSQAIDNVGTSGSTLSASSTQQSGYRSIHNINVRLTLPRVAVQEYKELPSTRSEVVPFLAIRESKQDLTPRSNAEDLSGCIIWTLPRVLLVASDVHVISAVEDSLANLSSAAQSCHFFSTVMLHDFPSEVFLQYPGIIRQLLKLMKNSSPVISAAVECLLAFTQLLQNQLMFCSQLEFTTLKSQVSESSSGDAAGVDEQASATPREVVQQYQQEGYLSSSSDQHSLSKRIDPLTIPQYGLVLLNCAVELVGREQRTTPLVLQALKLLAAVAPDVHGLWQGNTRNHTLARDLLSSLLKVLTAVLKQSISYEAVMELHTIAVSLRIIETLVPVDLALSLLPTELQEIICFSLIDPMLAISCPHLHSMALTYASVLKHKGMLIYQEVATVLTSMQASVKFTEEAATLPTCEALDLFHSALLALPFHRDLSIIKQLTQYLMERRDLTEAEVDQAAKLTRTLLAHSEKTIVTEAYRVFHNLITSTLGPQQAISVMDPCPRLRFIINTSVLVEMVCHGVKNTDNKICQNAEDMLLHILKCQMLVSDSSWHRVLEQLAPVLPLLQCHASKVSPLGRATLHMLDPDVAGTAALSNLQVLSGNCRLLLLKDPLCREEAATRLLWLTKLTHLTHKRLADVCVLDVAISTHTPVTGMYEVGSVVRVLEVLSGPCVEARVKQSCLTQLSVMTEDSRLHQVFIEEQGVELFTSILKNVSEETNEDASGYIIPIISTLKHLARHNATIRQNLSHNKPFLICVLKSLFQLSEWRLQRDATQLLALLMYSDFVLSSAATVSLPQLVVESVCLPFPSQTHWTVSPNCTSSLKGVVLGHVGAERLLALQWTVLQQGLDCILQWTDVPPTQGPLSLSLRAVRQVQQSHVAHNCRLLLYAFQNATSHETAIQALRGLICYVELNWLVEVDSLTSLPWKNTFRKFLLTPPACQDDFSLLLMVLKFLQFLIGVCPAQCGWVSEALQTAPHTLINLIVTANSSHVRNDDQEMWKKICLSILNLCQACLKQGSADGWQVLVQLILRCLDFSHTQHFYSLALLDSKLQCLLAAVTDGATDSALLWQLLTAFHCQSALSFMGLSITRHTLLCLNKLLAFTQDWEHRWLPESNLCWLPALWTSRDVLVRASALQLMSGLARSVRGAGTVLQQSEGLFDSVLRIVMDHTEASIVREHAAVLLANVVKNSSSKEFSVSAQKFGLYQELKESVGLVALAPVITHTDASTEMLFTHPRFIKAACWLVNNLLASAYDQTLQLISDSGLSTALCRTLVDVYKLDSCEMVRMCAAVCRLLTHCCSGLDSGLLQETLPALLCLLDPANFVTDWNVMAKEVKSLWQETLRLLSAVLPLSDSALVLPDSAVGTCCQCIADDTTPLLKISALQAVTAAAKCFTPRDEVSVYEALLDQWLTASGKSRSALLSALTALLGHSSTATEAALTSGLLTSILSSLQQIHLTLTVQTSSTEKLKKNNPTLNQLVQYMTLLTNFFYGSNAVKQAAARQGAADLVHKLWLWCQADDKYLITALHLLITFTADCPEAAQTLVLTSTVPGVGQRRSPTSHSLVHALVSLLTREQHPLSVRGKTLTLLTHCCQAQECRIIIAKSTLLSWWSDQWADKRQLAEEVEVLWLRFILVFTSFPEGQTSLPKTGDLFNQLISCAEGGRLSCRPLSLAVLRNLAAFQANKPRFLCTRSSLVLLSEKLLSGSQNEKKDAALIVWALAANHQKAKIALRGLGLISRLQLAAATSDDVIFSSVVDLLMKPR